jgi:hypothetical protein
VVRVVGAVFDDTDLVAVACKEAGELDVVHRAGDGALADLRTSATPSFSEVDPSVCVDLVCFIPYSQD